MRGAAAFSVFLLLPQLPGSSSHGQITWPPSTRHGGNVHAAADCARGECFYFNNNVEIPGPGTLPQTARSMEPEVVGGKYDVWRTHPWRAPGTAPVFGSGCGVAGGHPTLSFANGGVPPFGIPIGLDGAFLPQVGDVAPARWRKGQTAEVAWAMSANHAGGYAWRLCKVFDGTEGETEDASEVTESCFQAGHLRFAEDDSFALWPNGSRFVLPNKIVKNGTHPRGSEWKRVPVPTCRVCVSAYDQCGSPLLPTPGLDYGSVWNRQVNCYAACAGSSVSKFTEGGFCPDSTQFQNIRDDGDDIANGNTTATQYSGYGKSIWAWSVLDKVLVPATLATGTYKLSWRWDCEQSAQVWQNCADVEVVDDTTEDTNWDVASLGNMELVPKVTRGGAVTNTNERCVALIEQCRTENGNESGNCADGKIEETCVAEKRSAAGEPRRDAFGVWKIGALLLMLL